VVSGRSVIRALSVLLCLFAAFVSYKLLAKHVTGSSGSTWFDARCTDESPGGADCDAVLATPWSYFPPKRAGDPPGRLHIPIAFLGFLHFSMLAVWLVGAGAPSPGRRWIHALTVLWALCGFLSSVVFTYIMFTRIDEWCPWCLLTHVLNMFVLIGVVLLWPWTKRTDAAPPVSAAKVEPRGSANIRPVAPPHPSWKRLFGTAGVMFVVAYGGFGQSGLLAARRANGNLQRCLTAVSRIRGDVPRLLNSWKAGRSWSITVRPDDPVRPSAVPDRPSLDVVVFSDFECPSCSRFALFFEEQVRPLFAGRVRTVFKHYPMDRTCNRHVSRTLHAHACTAARIAEASRLQGGNDAFWRTHDLLFTHQQDGVEGRVPVTAAQVAATLKLDPAKLGEDMESTLVAERIEQDTALGRACAVRGTPAVFVARRRVDPLAAMQLGFWDRLADEFWKQAGEPRPPSSRIKADKVIPDSRDQPDAP
jgi:protein-disulfide isomerase/uncharacterized membrane protein